MLAHTRVRKRARTHRLVLCVQTLQGTTFGYPKNMIFPSLAQSCHRASGPGAVRTADMARRTPSRSGRHRGLHTARLLPFVRA